MSARRYIFLIVTAALVLLAVWLWGSGLLVLFLFLFLVGDTHNELYAAVPYASFAAGLALASLFLYRSLSRKASRWFIRSHLWIACLLLCVYVGFWSSNEISGVRGTTPQAAARAILSDRYGEQRVERFRLIEEDRLDLQRFGRGPTIHFLVEEGDSKVCRIGVSCRWWHWWTFASYSTDVP
ncbi:MAG: hypothetical protein IH889_09930 [Planctomycetes bacterium]|nr:hypothetical protein [Planctomycetota bacterium]